LDLVSVVGASEPLSGAASASADTNKLLRPCVVLATESTGREENSLSLVRLASALLPNSISELSFRRSVPLLHTLEGCSGSGGEHQLHRLQRLGDIATGEDSSYQGDSGCPNWWEGLDRCDDLRAVE
jgi:hypothetical protein